MNKNFISFLLLFLFFKSYSQDSLKHFSKIYQLPITAALSHYPELTNLRINFIEADIESTGKTTINLLGILNKRKRVYIIKINKNKQTTGFVLTDLNLMEQTGVIGHELAHVADFSHRNFIQMIKWGFDYLIKSKRRNIERSADQQTIAHGLGKELFEWSSYVLSTPLTTNKYKQMRKKYYLLPSEIHY